MKLLDEDGLLQVIKEMVAEYGSQKKTAEKLGISLQYLNDFLSGRRAAGEKILSAMGLRKVVMYEVMNIEEVHEKWNRMV